MFVSDVRLQMFGHGKSMTIFQWSELENQMAPVMLKVANSDIVFVQQTSLGWHWWKTAF